MRESSGQIKTDKEKTPRFTLRETELRTRWPLRDYEIDIRWNEFVDDLDQISKGEIIGATLTKPTGALSSPVMFVWNYPSWWTNRGQTLWGEVLDESNPCVSMQYAKLGPSSLIKSQNRIPIRNI